MSCMQHLGWIRQKWSCGCHLFGEFGHLHSIFYQHLKWCQSINCMRLLQGWDYFNATGWVVVHKSFQWSSSGKEQAVSNLLRVESNCANVASLSCLRGAKVPALKGMFKTLHWWKECMKLCRTPPSYVTSGKFPRLGLLGTVEVQKASESAFRSLCRSQCQWRHDYIHPEGWHSPNKMEWLQFNKFVVTSSVFISSISLLVDNCWRIWVLSI